MSCRNCGSEIGPTGVCQLCGHNEQEAALRRKRVFWGWLKALFLIGTAIEIGFYVGSYTERSAAAKAAVAKMESSTAVVQLLGKPIKILSGVRGEVTHDETGWKEARLTIPVHGPGGDAVAHVVGGRGTGPWTFTTFQVLVEKQHKKLDLVSGRVVDYDPSAYVDIHTQAAIPPEFFDDAPVPLPRMDGKHSCVFASLEGSAVVPHPGKCSMPTSRGTPVDRFEADLRYGRFVIRQTDLYLSDVFEVRSHVLTTRRTRSLTQSTLLVGMRVTRLTLLPEARGIPTLSS